MNLKQFLGMCEHKWKIISRNYVNNEDNKTIGEKFVLQCEKCGRLKTEKSFGG